MESRFGKSQKAAKLMGNGTTRKVALQFAPHALVLDALTMLTAPQDVSEGIFSSRKKKRTGIWCMSKGSYWSSQRQPNIFKNFQSISTNQRTILLDIAITHYCFQNQIPHISICRLTFALSHTYHTPHTRSEIKNKLRMPRDEIKPRCSYW